MQPDEYGEIDAVLPGACFGSFRLPSEKAFVVSHGKGSHLWAETGAEYIDHVLGAGALVLGHCHPGVVKAVEAQLHRGASFYTLSRPAIALAEELARIVPCAQAVKFAASGSEATFMAMRLARAFTGRDKVLKFRGAYHGNHDYAQQSINRVHPEVSWFGADESAGIPARVGRNVVVAEFNDLSSVEAVLAGVGSEVAAIVVEPVQRSLAASGSFLAGLSTLARENGCLLVYDEVVTGFRLGLAGAQGEYGVLPDLCCFGKTLGGGLPIGAVTGRREVIEGAVPGETQGTKPVRVTVTATFSGNPLSAAAGLATLSALKEEGTYERLRALTEELASHLEAEVEGAPVPLQIVKATGMVDLVVSDRPVGTHRDMRRMDQTPIVRAKTEAVATGIFLNPGRALYVSTCHSSAELERTAAVLGSWLRNSNARRFVGAASP